MVLSDADDQKPKPWAISDAVSMVAPHVAGSFLAARLAALPARFFAVFLACLALSAKLCLFLSSVMAVNASSWLVVKPTRAVSESVA